MAGTQMEASLGVGTMQERSGLHTPFLRYWRFSEGRAPQATRRCPQVWAGRLGGPVPEGKAAEGADSGDCRGAPGWVRGAGPPHPPDLRGERSRAPSSSRPGQVACL